jgi:hypothetical protein
MSVLGDPNGDDDAAAGAAELTQQDRDSAVAALDVHRDAGRLDDVGFEERSVRVARAGTRRDVELLFLDLPDPHPVLGAPAWGSAPSAGEAIPPAPVGTRPPAPSGTSSPVPYGSSSPAPQPGVGRPGQAGGRGPGLVPEPYGRMVIALAPFVALVLFFVTRQWIWFLLIPVVAIVVRGPNGHRRR